MIRISQAEIGHTAIVLHLGERLLHTGRDLSTSFYHSVLRSEWVLSAEGDGHEWGAHGHPMCPPWFVGVAWHDLEGAARALLDAVNADRDAVYEWSGRMVRWRTRHEDLPHVPGVCPLPDGPDPADDETDRSTVTTEE